MKAILGTLLALALVSTAGRALADQGKVKDDLGHYFPIREALAADKTEGVKDHADALAKSSDRNVARAAAALAKAASLDAARKAFGDVSKALIVAIEKASKAGADVGAVYVFECPMAKPYGKWLQATEDMGNPYYGSSMLKCGKKVATFGEGKPGEQGGHGEHGGHGGGHH